VFATHRENGGGTLFWSYQFPYIAALHFGTLHIGTGLPRLR